MLTRFSLKAVFAISNRVNGRIFNANRLFYNNRRYSSHQMEKSRANNNKNEVTLFAMNCYLIPGLLVNPDNATCNNQDKRAAKIGKLASNYDLVVLQEVWGSRVDLLQAPLINTHQIAPENTSWNLFGFGASVIDSVRFYLKRNGGLYFANSKALKQNKVWRYTFTVSQTKSKKGLQAVLLDMSSRWGPEKYLIVVNTHLDPSNRTSQRQQLIEIAQFMKTLLLDPALNNKRPENIAMVLIGDFNIPSGTQWYNVITELFAARDLMAEFCKKSGKREEATYSQHNSLVIWKDAEQRIDYCWAIDRLDDLEFLKLDVVDASVVKQQAGEELSDHWGQLFTIIPRNK